jgi:hypothetical protein
MGEVMRRGEDRLRHLVNVPAMISSYQTHMRGVDLLDQRVGYYMPLLRSRKWWRREFFYLLQVSVHNAYILAKAANPVEVHRMYPRLRDFIEGLASELIGNTRVKRDAPIVGQPQNVGLHTIAKMYERKKVCKECCINFPDISSDRKTTLFGCRQCNMPVHRKCEIVHIQRMCQ